MLREGNIFEDIGVQHLRYLIFWMMVVCAVGLYGLPKEVLFPTDHGHEDVVGEALSIEELILPHDDGERELEWEGWAMIFILVGVFIVLVSECIPPDLVMLAGSCFLFVMGILTSEEFLYGFSQDIVFTLAMLCIIVRALDVNGLLNFLARMLLPKTKSMVKGLLAVMFPLGVGSAFLNNTPIVLLLTPVIRRWALDQGSYPSKYLIPLSFATILGGSCSLIGTSSNIIVDGLVRGHQGAGFSFFEFAIVGGPCVIAGILYMITIGHRLLPERQDPAIALAEQTKEFTGEFVVTKECPFAGKEISEIAPTYFRGEVLIEIERQGMRIRSPILREILYVGDRLVFAGDIKEIAQLHAIKGLKSLADPHFHLDTQSSHFSEVIIAATSSMIGNTLKFLRFRQYYGASVLAIYRQGKRVPGRVGDIPLQAGDTLMLLSSGPWPQEESKYYSNDFFIIRHSEKLPLFVAKKAFFVVAVLLCMIIAVLIGVPIIVASSVAALTLALTRCVSIQGIRQSIRWNLLILVASAYAFATGIAKTGVAHYLAASIMPLIGANPYVFVAGIFFLTMVITELITNNAAALLLFPIAIEAARLSGFTGIGAVKAVGITVAIAASCSFWTPIGYQTNTIVYGPGGYKFIDYTKVGVPLSLIIFVIAVAIIPNVWQMT